MLAGKQLVGDVLGAQPEVLGQVAQRHRQVVADQQAGHGQGVEPERRLDAVVVREDQAVKMSVVRQARGGAPVNLRQHVAGFFVVVPAHGAIGGADGAAVRLEPRVAHVRFRRHLTEGVVDAEQSLKI